MPVIVDARLGQSSRVCSGACWSTRGERLTPSHAVKKGRRYRYYVSAPLTTTADEADRAPGWRLPAREIEDAVITRLADALNSPARVIECFSNAATSSEQIGKITCSRPPARCKAQRPAQATSNPRPRNWICHSIGASSGDS
jgi:hypothetical protein